MADRPLLKIPLKVFLYIADPLQVLADGYDTIAIRRSEDGGATFIDLDDDRLPMRIDAGRCNYAYQDQEGEEQFLYEPVLVDSTGTNPPKAQSPRQAVDVTFESLLTIEELRNIWLFGIDLTDDEGNEFPDELFVHYIRTAISQTEYELDLSLMPAKIVENHDFRIRDYERYMFVQLHVKPVIEITSVRLEYPAGQTIIEFPIEWIRTKHHAGQFEILPARGTFTQLLVSAGGGFLPLVFGGSDYIPDIIKVEYQAGFLLGEANFGRTSPTGPLRLPAAIKEIIGKKAAFGPLNTAGDLIVGAGIANKSLSIDGVSQTIGTTSSATNAGYGSRLIQYEKELKKAIPDIRRYFHGARMVVA